MQRKDENRISIAAQFLISRASRPLLIEAEIRNSKIEDFVAEYNELTEGNQEWSDISADGHAMDMGEGKWGIEVRIYFPKDEAVMNQMRRYGFAVENGSVRMRNSLRINNRKLFRELVSTHRLRIGYND